MKTSELVVLDKYSGRQIARVPQCSAKDASSIVATAREGARVWGRAPRHLRARVLNSVADAMDARHNHFVDLVVAESGKTWIQASKEVRRAAHTFRLSAIEASRNAGEVISFDAVEAAEERRGWFTREPLGIIVAITPFNDPLNLVAHKIGPAIAAGNSVILHPSSWTPLSALEIAKSFADCDLPRGVLTVAVGDDKLAGALVAAPDVRLVSFTGGFAAGRAIAQEAGIKRLTMELGGNAPILIFSDADLPDAVNRCIEGGYWAAGQNCIGAQRILVQRPVYAAFVAAFARGVAQLRTGDPRDRDTDVGPMISCAAAAAAHQKIQDAVAAGARVLVGGAREGSVLEPTVIVDAPRDCTLWTAEAFAPIVLVDAFDTEDEAIRLANDGDFALQAGVFTKSIDRALRIADSIEAGGVMINDSSDVRIDSMPFGGAKFGSMGREGVRFAFEEMTQPKVVAIRVLADTTHDDIAGLDPHHDLIPRGNV